MNGPRPQNAHSLRRQTYKWAIVKPGVMFIDGRNKGYFDGGGEGVISYIKRKLELNPK